MAKARVEVAGSDPVVSRHLVEGLVGKEGDLGSLLGCLEQGRWELIELGLEHDLVDPAPALLTDADSPQQ